MTPADELVYLIQYDDHERRPNIVIGKDAAQALYERISTQWNAHLFVKLHSNSRDSSYAQNNATIQEIAPAPAASPVMLTTPEATLTLASEPQKAITLSMQAVDGTQVQMQVQINGENPRTQRALLALMKAMQEDKDEALFKSARS